MFTGNGIQPGITLLTELLVALGLCSLLLLVEPLGALIVVSVLGAAAWGFHRLTRGHIARWGKARQYHDGMRLQHLQQGLGGAKDVTLLGRETDVLDQYRAHNAQSARVSQLHTTLQQFPRLGLELLTVSGLAILVISMLAQDRAARLLLEI